MFYLALILIAFAVLAMILPLVPSSFWLFRAFDYPRPQLILIDLLAVVALWAYFGGANWAWAVGTALLLNAAYITRLIFPYTKLARKEVSSYTRNQPHQGQFHILSWNAYQYNRQAGAFLKLVAQHDPDVVLVCETDEWWCEALEELKSTYPHVVVEPQDNTYGMCLYSRFPLSEAQIHHLVDDDVPCIEAVITHPDSGAAIQLYCAHPIPPAPRFSKSTLPRDAEMLIIGKKAGASDLPVVVIGDLNDVAWSYSVRLFQKTSGLLDLRKGRGILPTFPADRPWLGVPIDQVFTRPDFTVVGIERLPANGV